MDPDDDLERFDDALGASLRRHASELTGPIDVAAPWADIDRRARTRRRWRFAAASVGTAAAATVAVVGFLAVSDGDREVLRAPATQPGRPADITTGPAVTTTDVPSSSVIAPTTTVAPSSSVIAPTTTVTPAPSPTVPAAQPSATAASTMPPTTVDAPAPAPAASVTSYSSAGGSIDIRLAGGTIALSGDPVPTPGWSVHIDDDGPDRVRVRFEREGDRSEIRVDLTSDGRLDPRITEG